MSSQIESLNTVIVFQIHFREEEGKGGCKRLFATVFMAVEFRFVTVCCTYILFFNTEKGAGGGDGGGTPVSGTNSRTQIQPGKAFNISLS